MTSVLMTGATGYLGRHLMKKFEDLNWEVVMSNGTRGYLLSLKKFKIFEKLFVLPNWGFFLNKCSNALFCIFCHHIFCHFFIKNLNVQETPIDTFDENIDFETSPEVSQTTTFSTKNYVKIYSDQKNLAFNYKYIRWGCVGKYDTTTRWIKFKK